MGKKTKIRIRDEHPGSYFRELKTIFWVKILEFFDADADPGIFLTLDLGWKKIRIRDNHPSSATLDTSKQRLHELIHTAIRKTLFRRFNAKKCCCI
jgi:aminoglycoside/choline kinase family phosphotransferase